MNPDHAMDTGTSSVCGNDGARVEAGSRSAVQQRLVDLEQLSASELRQNWRRIFRSDPPQLSRDLLLRALAYRLQEREHGGLSKVTLRRIASQTREFRSEGAERSAPSARIRPGARIVREWRGRSHSVTVTELGFEYDGKTYASLTPIAQAITGVHWSGPRFFGLAKTSTQRAVKPVPVLSRMEARHG